MSLRDRLTQLKSSLSGTANVAESSNYLKETELLTLHTEQLKGIAKAISKRQKAYESFLEAERQLETAFDEYSKLASNVLPYSQLPHALREASRLDKQLTDTYARLEERAESFLGTQLDNFVQEATRASSAVKKNYEKDLREFDAAISKVKTLRTSKKATTEKLREADAEVTTTRDAYEKTEKESIAALKLANTRSELTALKSILMYWEAQQSFLKDNTEYFDTIRSKLDRFKIYLNDLENPVDEEKTRVFKVPIGDLAKRENRRVPRLIVACTDFITKHMVNMQGVFRLSAIKDDLDDIKVRLDRGHSPDFYDSLDNPHVVTGILKQYLREMPDPLFTFDLYDEFIKAGRINDAAAQSVELKRLIDKLPIVNKKTLQHIAKMCEAISANSEENKMTAPNLAIVLGPNCVYSKTPSDPMNMVQEMETANYIFGRVIQQYSAMFPAEEDDLALDSYTPPSVASNPALAATTGAKAPASSAVTVGTEEAAKKTPVRKKMRKDSRSMSTSGDMRSRLQLPADRTVTTSEPSSPSGAPSMIVSPKGPKAMLKKHSVIFPGENKSPVESPELKKKKKKREGSSSSKRRSAPRPAKDNISITGGPTEAVTSDSSEAGTNMPKPADAPEPALASATSEEPNTKPAEPEAGGSAATAETTHPANAEAASPAEAKPDEKPSDESTEDKSDEDKSSPAEPETPPVDVTTASITLDLKGVPAAVSEPSPASQLSGASESDDESDNEDTIAQSSPLETISEQDEPSSSSMSTPSKEHQSVISNMKPPTPISVNFTRKDGWNSSPVAAEIKTQPRKPDAEEPPRTRSSMESLMSPRSTAQNAADALELTIRTVSPMSELELLAEPKRPITALSHQISKLVYLSYSSRFGQSQLEHLNVTVREIAQMSKLLASELPQYMDAFQNETINLQSSLLGLQNELRNVVLCVKDIVLDPAGVEPRMRLGSSSQLLISSLQQLFESAYAGTRDNLNKLVSESIQQVASALGLILRGAIAKTLSFDYKQLEEKFQAEASEFVRLVELRSCLLGSADSQALEEELDRAVGTVQSFLDKTASIAADPFDDAAVADIRVLARDMVASLRAVEALIKQDTIDVLYDERSLRRQLASATKVLREWELNPRSDKQDPFRLEAKPHVGQICEKIINFISKPDYWSPPDMMRAVDSICQAATMILIAIREKKLETDGAESEASEHLHIRAYASAAMASLTRVRISGALVCLEMNDDIYRLLLASMARLFNVFHALLL